jgi:hypothetical protein
VDGLGGFSDGPEGRWQRYPDQRYADQGFQDRGFADSGTGGFDQEPERDSRSFGERPYDGRYEPREPARSFSDRDRHADSDDGYRVPEPRFGDLAGPRYPENAEPRFGGPEQRYDSRDPGGFEPGGFAAAPPAGPREEARPPAPPVDEREHHLTEQIDRSALRRPPAGPPPAPAGPAPTVYRSRRPALIILLVIVSIVVEMLLLFVLGHGLLVGKFAAGEVLAAIFAMAGTPLTAIGLYAVVTGAPAATGAHPAQSWFRAPTAYLPVGLVLLVAAALAVR